MSIELHTHALYTMYHVQLLREKIKIQRNFPRKPIIFNSPTRGRTENNQKDKDGTHQPNNTDPQNRRKPDMGHRMHKRMRNDGKFYCMLAAAWPPIVV